MEWFSGKDLPLQQAIDADDVAKLHAALDAGAQVNARGKHAVTPLEYAIGHDSKKTYAELLRLHADPNQRDIEGDNAVILAVRSFEKDPEYLKLALENGGDPNVRQADGDPVIARFKASHNVDGIRMMKQLGADLDVRRRTGDPLIVNAAMTQDWDIVWALIELGARYDYTGEMYTIVTGFQNAAATPPDSPLYRYKQQTWQFLHAHGVAVPPLQ